MGPKLQPSPLKGFALACLVFWGLPHAWAEKPDTQTQLRKDVTFLASDECEGRGIATKGINLAADYISNEFKKAGLKPGGTGGSYFQPFMMANGPATLGNPNLVVLLGPEHKEIELKIGEQFQPLGLSGSGEITAPLVFAGFGITADTIHYDDYREMDVAGKVVIILRRTPRSQTDAQGNPLHPFDGTYNDHHAALITKVVNADLHKAAAILFVSDREQTKDNDPLMDFNLTAEGTSPLKLPVLHVHRELVNQILKSSLGKELAELEEAIDKDLKPHSFLLPGWNVNLNIHVIHPSLKASNIVGIADGHGPLGEQTVVIGAHYDHLGYGGRGSLARSKEPAIHHGADDNASGTTVLMELARLIGSQKSRQGRRLVFIAFSGEESGLLGSEYYCQNPAFPLDGTVAMINMDMVGRLRPDKGTNQDKLVVYGTGTSKEFPDLLDTVNKTYDFKLQKVVGATMVSERSTSDHASFYAKKVPILFFFTGNHPDYHRPTDTADKINIAGMERITNLVADLVVRLSQDIQRPMYVKVTTNPNIASVHSTGRMPRLGIQPNYGDETDGVLIDAVSENGPAEKAGFKEGDRIVELDGQLVKNLDGYMVLMARHKKGEPIEVTILRSGSKQKIKVTPE